MGNLLSQEININFQLPNLALRFLSPLLGTNTEFLNNLDNAPETQNHDQGGNLLNDAVQDNVGDETCDDDERVKAVKPRFEVAKLISTCDL